MRTIAEIAKVGYKNGINKKRSDKKCKGFEETQKYHGTTVQRTFKFINDYVISRKVVYKEHILPTIEHLKILDKVECNFVSLIRNPEGVINSYKRVFSVLEEIDIDYERLYVEAKHFYDVYDSYENKKCLNIKYEDLVMNEDKYIKKILKHLGIEYDLKKKYELLKYNYTGIGKQELKQEILAGIMYENNKKLRLE
jgi:hypothetical protein